MQITTNALSFFKTELWPTTLRQVSSAKLITTQVHDINQRKIKAAVPQSISAQDFLCCIRAVMGRPPHQFQIELRVERAKALLADPALSLVNVALMVGFGSQSHFSDCFQRIKGATPARYRAEMQIQIKPPKNSESENEVCAALADVIN